MTLPTTAARQTAPCKTNDIICWCLIAVKYTNEVRRRHGVKTPLTVGTQSQLNNALRYAKYLAQNDRFEHQNLPSATKEVKCKRWVGGENLALNYESGDVAKRAVMQWEGSKKHLDNIKKDWYKEVVVGFYFMPNGRVYAVQTFALVHEFGTFGSVNDPGCNIIRGGGGEDRSGPAPRPTKQPTRKAPPSPRPVRGPKRKPTPRPVKRGPLRSDQANRACRCLEKGPFCWHSLRALSGNRCYPFRSTARQPRGCKVACCFYCRRYSRNPVCTNMVVRRVCNSL